MYNNNKQLYSCLLCCRLIDPKSMGLLLGSPFCPVDLCACVCAHFILFMVFFFLRGGCLSKSLFGLTVLTETSVRQPPGKPVMFVSAFTLCTMG